MKIAWFTPFRKTSAIGRFSRLVTDRLARDARVDLWLADPENEELHETALRVVRYAQLPKAERFLADYDVIVYNLGDQFANHGAIFDMSRQRPGVIILHDYVMHDFFAEYYNEHNTWAEYAAVMKRWYGAGPRLTAKGWTGEIWRVWERDEVLRYPLFEEALVGCAGVVTHADFVRDAVSRVIGAPAVKIPLAYTSESAEPPLSRRELQIPDDRVLVVTVGHPNKNKRIHIVLQALAANRDLTDSITYVVIGARETPFAQTLQALCKDLGLQDTVRFTGYVSDHILHSYLVHAAICVNLRWPALEGGSASCAEQMLQGKPVIVTDTGVYSELPGNCARKVRPEHELEDFTRRLRELISDANLRKTIGEAARQYAESNFNPEIYARRFLSFCDELAYYKPAVAMMDTAARELRKIGATSNMAIVDTVSREGALLTGGDYNPPVLRKPS